MGAGASAMSSSAPTISKPLATVSPSLAERLLACPLRVAFDQDSRAGREPRRSSSAQVGRAVHRAIELCLLDADMPAAEAWEAACEELATKGDDPRQVPSARRAQLRLGRRLPELLLFVTSREPTELRLEVELVSRDRTVRGRLDLLIVGPRPCVVDYKTGAAVADGLVVSEYERHP